MTDAPEDPEAAEAASQADAERALDAAWHAAVIDLAKGAIDRSRAGAQFIQTSAAALLGTYAALLALTFAVKDHPLTMRGLYAPVFLGLAVALALAYLCFIGPPEQLKMWEPGETQADTQLRRTAGFVAWTAEAVSSRALFLRASVVAFGVGVAFLPAAFLGPTGAAVAAPQPPTLPSRVADGLEVQSQELAQAALKSYHEALMSYSESAKPRDCETIGWHVLPIRACDWRTSSGVDRSVRNLAVLGGFLVLITATLGGRRSKIKQ